MIIGFESIGWRVDQSIFGITHLFFWASLPGVTFQETAQLKDVAKLTHSVSQPRFINATEAETKEAVSRMTNRKLLFGHPENATVAKVTFL